MSNAKSAQQDRPWTSKIRDAYIHDVILPR